MENRINKAKEIHNKGGNCCQAVVCAFADLLNKDEETLYSAAEGFGLGMGNIAISFTNVPLVWAI